MGCRAMEAADVLVTHPEEPRASLLAVVRASRASCFFFRRQSPASAPDAPCAATTPTESNDRTPSRRIAWPPAPRSTVWATMRRIHFPPLTYAFKQTDHLLFLVSLRNREMVCHCSNYTDLAARWCLELNRPTFIQRIPILFRQNE